MFYGLLRCLALKARFCRIPCW